MTTPKAKDGNTKKPLTTWVDMMCGNETAVRFYCRSCGESIWLGKGGFLKFVRTVLFWESMHKHVPDAIKETKK